VAVVVKYADNILKVSAAAFRRLPDLFRSSPAEGAVAGCFGGRLCPFVLV
jgi:hypothetical protein